MPLELLLRCFSHLEDKRAALSSCRRLARAVLLNSLQQEQPACLRWDVDRAEPFAPSARLVQALVGEQANKGLTLVFFSDDEYDYRSPALCLDELRASGAALPCITRLEMQVCTRTLLFCTEMSELSSRPARRDLPSAGPLAGRAHR